MNLIRIARSAGATGSIASAITTAVLVVLTKATGKHAVQPTNATSHWRHGEDAGHVQKMDLAHTGVGYATHHASSVFWAFPFEVWNAARSPRGIAGLFGRAAAVAGIAAVIDYGLVPKRGTPGWEEVQGPRIVAAAFGALAVGLAAGALLSREFARK